jgi:argininosuccinate lyase
LKDCLEMMCLMLSNISIKENILNDPKYQYLFSVEEVNKLVLQGIPFRDAYKQIGQQIEQGTFGHSHQVNHVHEGSIGNLCNTEIEGMMQNVIESFGFEKVQLSIKSLLSS